MHRQKWLSQNARLDHFMLLSIPQILRKMVVGFAGGMAFTPRNPPLELPQIGSNT